MAKIVGFLAFLTALAAVLAVSIGGAAKPPLRPPQPEGHLAQLVPMNSGKWIGRDIPLGETEEVIRASENLLAVSEFLSRRYFCAGNPKREFTLYISYWAAGKETVAKASTHMPDNCWVRNGAKNIKEKKRDDAVFDVCGVKLFPAHLRTFAFPQKDGSSVCRNAVYWYMVDGNPYSYGGGDTAIPSPSNYVKNMWRQARMGIPEQYFVRVDSFEDLAELFADEDFRKILEGLAKSVLSDASNK